MIVDVTFANEHSRCGFEINIGILLLQNGLPTLYVTGCRLGKHFAGKGRVAASRDIARARGHQ